MIRKELIFLNEELDSREEILNFITEKAKDIELVTDEKSYLSDVLNREKEAPTSVGYGIAIPHGRSDVVKESFIAFLKTKFPIEWDSRNKEMVKSIFLIGVPLIEGNRTHLLFLSQISRKLMNETFRTQLNECQTSNEAFILLNEINLKIMEKEV